MAGRWLSWPAIVVGKTHIWVRTLSTAGASMVEGTGGGTKPFWSPRADALGYFVGNNLMTVSLNGDYPLPADLSDRGAQRRLMGKKRCDPVR